VVSLLPPRSSRPDIYPTIPSPFLSSPVPLHFARRNPLFHSPPPIPRCVGMLVISKSLPSTITLAL